MMRENGTRAIVQQAVGQSRVGPGLALDVQLSQETGEGNERLAVGEAALEAARAELVAAA
jgi:hypothetical protein